MTAVVIRGDARRLPLPDASVDLIVTSPPYFGLRSYTDTCRICLDIRHDGLDPAEVLPGYDEHVRTRHHYDGQIGSEATPAEWVAALMECTREWIRVLKPSGSLFVNMGDKYAAAAGGRQAAIGESPKNGVVQRREATARRRDDLPNPPASWGTRDASPRVAVPGITPKSLMGLPWRYALACVDELGLILRRDIIWAKPNGLPESVTDRCRSSHEYLFHLVKQPRYYAAVDEIREDYGINTHTRAAASDYQRRVIRPQNPQNPQNGLSADQQPNPLGKLPGSVWSIPSQPLQVPAHLGVDHFAAFPMELPRRCVLGWSPPGICVACGEGRRPVVAKDYARTDVSPLKVRAHRDIAGHHRQGNGTLDRHDVSAQITSYTCSCSVCICTHHFIYHPNEGPCEVPGCTCQRFELLDQRRPPTRPAVVLDPFGGTGTTALVAAVHGRHGISIDRSADYTRLARWRTTDPGERAKAMQVPKPPPVMDGQDALFAL